MPSTYTKNLGIEKPGDGEQSNTWGRTVNINSDIQDRAAGGSLTLGIAGAASTLTSSQGVLSDGHYKVLYLVGAPSALHTLTIAPDSSQRVYFVHNTTPEDVLISQGSGAKATVPAGGSSVVYTDGQGASASVRNFTDNLAMTNAQITGGDISGLSTLTTAVLTATGGDATGLDTLETSDLTATGGTLSGLDSVGTDALTVTGVATFNGKAQFNEAIGEKIFDISGSTPALDPANGAIQTWTLSLNSTPTLSLTAGESMTLMIDAGSRSLTWPTIFWKTDGGAPPDLSNAGYTALVLWRVGNAVFGARVGDV